MQSALAPAARESGHIAHLWWIYFWVLAMVFAGVAIWLCIAVFKHRADSQDGGPGSNERGPLRFVVICVIATVVILFVLLFIDFFTGNAIYAKPDPKALAIKITGHQWWWEVRYENPQPSQIFTTANEVHVPVGKTVKLELQSSDVIHSFWVPNVHGKKDLVPGIPSTTWFTANRAGEFRGQCAEYCGEQHAHMRMIFVAQPQSEFAQWLAAQKKSAPQPVSNSQRRGRDLFMSRQCMMCHTIEGTNARAILGPDLTHVGSRSLIAAGQIPNTPENMRRWIADPQKIKPGVRMPANKFSDQDLNALVDYIESLK